MTREEAIAIFRGFKFLPREMEAVDMAIKALEQEPCEDTISRQAVLDAMYNLCGEGALENNPWRDNPHIDAIVDAILDLPPVTPKPKSGNQQKSEWVVSFHGFPPEPTTVCKKCGFDRDFNINPRYFNKIKYCPNCGKKMEVEE